MEVNNIYCGDSCKLLKEIPDKFIDLVVTSPPYDELRDYKGYFFEFHKIVKELYRIIKEGAVIVWVVGDQTKEGCESGTSFKQALYFMKLGFKLHDTMIYLKDPRYPDSSRYSQSFEYMFVFVKGKLKTFNPIQRKNNCSYIGKTCYNRNKDGSIVKVFNPSRGISNMVNYWYYSSGFMKTTKEKYAFKHPAMFPEDLARDHILSWSNRGDVVLDPFVGSGTTCKMAKLNGRKFIGIDISEEYCQIAKKRVRQESLLSLVDKHEGGNGIPPTSKEVGILATFL